MSPSSRTRRACTRLFVAAAAVAAALLAGSVRPAAAAVPCWKALLTDWYDGRIDNTYPIHCYTDALMRLKPDILIYTSAHDDIERALQSAIARQHRLGKPVTPGTPVVPTAVHIEPVRQLTETDVHSPPAVVTTRRHSYTPTRTVPIAIGAAASADSDTLPVPLLVSGALAGLLVAGCLGGLVVRRLRR